MSHWGSILLDRLTVSAQPVVELRGNIAVSFWLELPPLQAFALGGLAILAPILSTLLLLQVDETRGVTIPRARLTMDSSHFEA